MGSRSIKPRSVITIGERNRITGAVKTTSRPEIVETEETAVAQQLTLLDTQPEKGNAKPKAKTRAKKR